jgi:hypothetical protein
MELDTPLKLEVNEENLNSQPLHNYTKITASKTINLEKGDTVQYTWRGHVQQAFFIGYNRRRDQVKVRKTKDFYMWIDTENIIKEVER